VSTSWPDQLGALLGEREVDPRLVELLVEFARSNTVDICSDGASGLVLSAASDANGAAYVRKQSLALALDPGGARQAAQQWGFSVSERNPTTHHVSVKNVDLDDPDRRAAIAGLLREAFDRAFQGERWTRGLPDRRLRRGDVCPTCHLEMPASGPCPDCG
jgi:hypothetical protein